MIKNVLAAIVFLAAGSRLLLAGEPAPVIKNPLASLPSAPGAHIEKIKALGEGEWLNLGSPAADPEWGKARGRAWGGKAFALAPDIRGAYFTGEGIHAYVKPDGYGMNDYWVYDINAHRWICVYPGTKVKGFGQQVRSGELKVNEHGLVIDKENRLLPGHLIHAWGFLAYDTDRREFAVAADCGYNKYYFPGTGYKSPDAKDVLEGLQLLKGQIKAETKLSPWFFSTVEGRFERHPLTGSRPTDMGTHPEFLYVPGRKRYLLVGEAGKIAFYDPERKSWESVQPKGTGPAGGDISACYDSKRGRIWIGAMGPAKKPGERNSLLAYDIENGTWSRPEAKGDCPQQWSTNRCSAHYDSAADVVLVFHYSERKLYTYDPKENKWNAPIAFPQETMKPSSCGHAFYDPELNAHFLFFAGDSTDNGIMWVYRYRRSTK